MTGPIDCGEYEGEIAKIKRTHLGFEDHGFYSFNVDFELGGAGQGTGHYALDVHDPEAPWGRVGTAAGMTLVIEFIKALGGGEWENLPGSTCLVLRKKGDWHGKILGVENLPTERGHRLIFSDIFDHFREKENA